jgi:DNA mismatch endonuclease (patch repair protein)
MADTVSKKKRSEIMSAVRSKDSEIEVKFRKALWKRGFRYRKNSAKYFGKPDLVLKKYKAVIFIDSCFWHGCEKHCRLPATRKKYWTKKIKRNKKRDKEVNLHYKNSDWQIIRVWEHELKKSLGKTLKKVTGSLKNDN